MPRLNIMTQSDIDKTPRVQQLEAMFDAPTEETIRLHWEGDFPFDDQDYNVGLIVGPSGSGKTTIARSLFGEPVHYDWRHKSVIDDFDDDLSIEQIAQVCQSVGFNTIPAWMRPYSVLSNGEKFRVDLARRLLSNDDPIVVDEFTSVVDRQVAQIGSYAVAKYVRKHNRRFIGVSCHYDIIEWLQPDWLFEPATMTFTRRSLRRRPDIVIDIQRVDYSYWRLFAPFHYLTNELNKAARCYVLFANGRPASFAGMLHRPHPITKNIKGCSRLVTLPDWQGLGLAMILIEKVAAAYTALGYQVRTYPAHPSLVRSFDKSTHWRLEKKPGTFSGKTGAGTTIGKGSPFGGRPCAIFSYHGPVMNNDDATALTV